MGSGGAWSLSASRSFFLSFFLFLFIYFLFLPTPTTHTHDPHPRPTTFTHDPRPTTFSYTPRLLFSTSVNIIIFSIKRDFSFEYKTVFKHPGFRKRFPSVDFVMCGSVRNRDTSCSLREWSKFQKVHFTFPSLDGAFLSGRLSNFYTTNYKEWALRPY